MDVNDDDSIFGLGIDDEFIFAAVAVVNAVAGAAQFYGDTYINKQPCYASHAHVSALVQLGDQVSLSNPTLQKFHQKDVPSALSDAQKDAMELLQKEEFLNSDDDIIAMVNIFRTDQLSAEIGVSWA